MDSLAISLPSADESTESSLTSKSTKEDNTPKDAMKASHCVFVGGLSSFASDESLTNSLTALFQKFGTVAGVRVLKDWNLRTYGFVQFTNENEYNNALIGAQGMMIEGYPIRVEPGRINRSLFLRSLKPISPAKLKKELQLYGQLEQFELTDSEGQFLSPDKQSIDQVGNYFVCRYSVRLDAVKAYMSLSENPKYEVQWVQNVYESSLSLVSPDSQVYDKFTIFIGHLPESVAEASLWERFSKYGEVDAIKVCRRATFAFAFVKYTKLESSIEAIENENHSIFLGRALLVGFRKFPHALKSSIQYSFKHKLELAPVPRAFKALENRAPSLAQSGSNWNNSSAQQADHYSYKYLAPHNYGPSARFAPHNYSESRRYGLVTRDEMERRKNAPYSYYHAEANYPAVQGYHNNDENEGSGYYYYVVDESKSQKSSRYPRALE